MTLLLVFVCLCLSFCNALFGVSLGRDQSASIRGRLMCNGQPASGIKVKMYDDDSGVDTDDFMGEARTDNNGYYQLQGSTAEFATIDVKMNIYHDCNDNMPCQRKFTIKIPDGYVSNGKNPTKVYDAGQLELAGGFSGESRDCLNR